MRPNLWDPDVPSLFWGEEVKVVVLLEVLELQPLVAPAELQLQLGLPAAGQLGDPQHREDLRPHLHREPGVGQFGGRGAESVVRVQWKLLCCDYLGGTALL